MTLYYYLHVAKEHGVKQVGSFQCLNGKVDLSTYEAEHTLDEWENQLYNLKDELSVRLLSLLVTVNYYIIPDSIVIIAMSVRPSVCLIPYAFNCDFYRGKSTENSV